MSGSDLKNSLLYTEDGTQFSDVAYDVNIQDQQTELVNLYFHSVIKKGTYLSNPLSINLEGNSVKLKKNYIYI